MKHDIPGTHNNKQNKLYRSNYECSKNIKSLNLNNDIGVASLRMA